MKPAKIVLFSPRPQTEGRYPMVPLSLLAVSRFLPKEGFDVKIIDSFMCDDYAGEILKNCEGALCMGITAMTGTQIEGGLRIARLVKKKYPSLPIVWGGCHPSILPEETVRSPYADFVVRGQGERTFEELVRALRSGSPFSSIRGLTYKKDGEPVSCPDRDFEDINSFPPMPYSLVDLDTYVIKTYMGARVIHYVSSQGCPNNCTFCSEPILTKRRWSGLDAGKVVDDIEWLVKNRAIDGVIMVDPNFFVNRERVRLICKGLIDRKVGIGWGGADATVRDIVRFDDELWRLLKESGCKSFLVGAESGSQDILDLIDKGATVDQTVQAAELCGRYGIRVVFSLMLGFPGQDIKEEFFLILDLIDRIMAKSSMHIFLIFIYTPYPGTPLASLSTQYGFQPPQTLEGWSRFHPSVRNTPWVSRKYAWLASMLMNYFFFFFGTRYAFRIALIQNRLLRGVVGFGYNMFNSIVRWRWKHRVFLFPMDYLVFRYLLWPIANRYFKTDGSEA